jgi:hypothetical protein
VDEDDLVDEDESPYTVEALDRHLAKLSAELHAREHTP